MAPGAGRQTASADYGTNGGSAFSRPSTAPASSDTVLVTTTEYNDAGMAYKTIDPAGREDRTEFDDLGRVTKTIQNYTDGNPATGGSDEDVTVEMTYNPNGTLATLTAKNPTTGDQTTGYVYGTAAGGITPYVYRNDLLRAEIYPDSDDTTALANGGDGVYDRVELEYNIRGEVIKRKDQNGTVHEYVLDKSGMLRNDCVTTLGAGVDGTVQRIAKTPSINGLLVIVTSYDNATVGSGNVLNEVVRGSAYSLANTYVDWQEHEGAYNLDSLGVIYNRDTTATSGVFTKGLRAGSFRYPNGRLVYTKYGTSGEMNDSIGYREGINVYAYVDASPLTFVDPLGLERHKHTVGSWWCYRVYVILEYDCDTAPSLVDAGVEGVADDVSVVLYGWTIEWDNVSIETETTEKCKADGVRTVQYKGTATGSLTLTFILGIKVGPIEVGLTFDTTVPADMDFDSGEMECGCCEP